MTNHDDDVRPRGATCFRLGALLLALATVAPAAALGDEMAIAVKPTNNAIYPVVGARDYLQVDQQPDNRGRLQAFDITVHNSAGASATYHVPAQPSARFALQEFDRSLGSGAWTLRDTIRGFGTFTVEVHITDRAGHDGAKACHGGYSAIGGHPQVYLRTIVWLESGGACAVESQRR